MTTVTTVQNSKLPLQNVKTVHRNMTLVITVRPSQIDYVVLFTMNAVLIPYNTWQDSPLSRCEAQPNVFSVF